MPRDIRGIEIEVGDTVAYPGRAGSSMWMNVGRVLEIVNRTRYRPYTESYEPDPFLRLLCQQKNWRGEDIGTRKSCTSKLDRVVVVEKWHANCGKVANNG